MNLDQIATKCFILALFIRDDGQRLLLGDGYYDFNQKLQHFQPNTIANDVVEIQGDNGQLLAGQVMRSGAQKFEGYIGDATTNRQTIEQKRSDFMAFFRIKHFYKVIYIFPDGTAIQRQRGYLTDAPTIPEIFQKFPEYSVALNFEDANYYEYAEDEHGDEIYAHIAELALAGGATGGLVWDAIGAVTNGITWSGIQTAQGEYIQITNELDIPAKLASVEMLGKAEQDGTPTPASPQPISVVTGENTVKIEGKNLFDINRTLGEPSNTAYANTTPRTFDFAEYVKGTSSNNYYAPNNITSFDVSNGNITLKTTQSAYGLGFAVPALPSTTYRISYTVAPAGGIASIGYYQKTGEWISNYSPSNGVFITPANCAFIVVSFRGSGDNVETTYSNIQLELGSTATAYEPYQGQEFEVNLGKNLWSPDNAQAFVTAVNNSDIASIETFDGKNCLSFQPSAGYGDYPHKNFTLGVNFRESTQYTISFDEYSTASNSHVAIWYTDGTYTTYPATPANTWNHVVLTSTAGKTIAYISPNYTAGTTHIDIDSVQLELGTQATQYSAYFTPIELAKIGNYQDRIYKTGGKWYIEKQVGKVVLDGTETWMFNESGTGYVRFTTVQSGIITSFSNSQIYTMSDKFVASTQTETVNANADANRVCVVTNGRLLFKTLDTSLNTVAKWQTWLGTNKPSVYYALATPTTTEITNEALIAQLDALGASSLYIGVNNIGTETLNAMPTLKIEYYTEYELEGAGYEWEPGGNTAKTIVTVAGVDSAWPIWTIQGEAQNPTLTNITTGQTISWQGFVPEGQTLTINMAEMTADLAGANVFEYVTGEWLRLAPGNNTLVYNAGNADKPSTLSWNGVLA